MSWIYENIDCLTTPCGDITVTDENGKKIVFSVEKILYDIEPDLFPGIDEKEIIDLDTKYEINIDVDDLKVGQSYKICLTGSKLGDGGSDEYWWAVSGTSNGYSIAIGAYDPNDHEVDKSKYESYSLERLYDYSGFVFHMLDKSAKCVFFDVIWIKNKKAGLEAEYESVVECFATY